MKVRKIEINMKLMNAYYVIRSSIFESGSLALVSLDKINQRLFRSKEFNDDRRLADSEEKQNVRLNWATMFVG
jgi:hypothetical protein